MNSLLPSAYCPGTMCLLSASFLRHFWEPFIKCVTLFLANSDPPPPVTLCHTSRDPQQCVTHLGPPIFSRPSTKISDKSLMYKFSLNCSRGILSGGFFRGSFVWKVLSGVVFVRSSFSHNTSVTTES